MVYTIDLSGQTIIVTGGNRGIGEYRAMLVSVSTQASARMLTLVGTVQVSP